MHFPSHGDLINGTFESFGALSICLNVRRLRIDKCIKGVDWRYVFVWISWSFFNCWYYPSLHQVFSFYAGLACGGANLIWLTLAIYYLTRKRNDLPAKSAE